MTQTMQAMVITKYGQKQLTAVQLPIPEIRANELLVAIHAASLNPLDFKIRDGQLKMLLTYQMPLILGNDFAGVVTQVGANVTDFKVGDAVFGRPNKQHIGTFAEYLAVDQADVALKPTGLSFEEAAAVPLVGLTAYQGLTELMQIQPGEKVLIQAGAGGVGTMAIQLAKYLGAYVATTTSAKNKLFVESLGADNVLDYHQVRFEDELQNYDYVFDTLGGDQLVKAFQIVKPGGKIISVAGLPNARFGKEYGLKKWQTALLRLVTRKITKLENQTQVQYDFLFMHPSGQQMAILAQLIDRHQLKPMIDRIVPFADFQQAADYLESGHAHGKVVLKIR